MKRNVLIIGAGGVAHVVATDLDRPLAVGESTHMGLGSHGVSVVVQG